MPGLRDGTGRVPRRVSPPSSTASVDSQIFVLLVPGKAGPPVRFLVVSVTVIVRPAPVDAGAPRAVTVRSGFLLNAAVQVLSASSVTSPSAQSASPDHPPKTEVAPGAGGERHDGSASKLFTQVAPQSMPGGVLVTVLVAAPVPVLVTVNL